MNLDSLLFALSVMAPVRRPNNVDGEFNQRSKCFRDLVECD